MKRKKIWHPEKDGFIKEWICLQCPFPYGDPNVKIKEELEEPDSMLNLPQVKESEIHKEEPIEPHFSSNNTNYFSKINDEDISVLQERAIQFVNNHEYEKARMYFDKILEINPDYVYTLANKGDEFHKMKKYEEAIVCYDVVLRIKPDYGGVLASKSFALFSLGRYEETITYSDRVLKMNPDDVWILSNKGDSLFLTGKYDEAKICYDKILEINPDYVITLYNEGDSLYNSGNHKEALTFFDAVLRINPSYADPLVNKGTALRTQNMHKEAVMYFDAVLGINPNYVEVLVMKGDTLYDLGRYEEAKVCYDKAITINPNYVINKIILNVNSSHKKDIGKGIARIDNQSMLSLGIVPNDIVEIQGRRRTPVRCLSLRPDQDGIETIRVDGLVRVNAGIKVGDRVRIKKVSPNNAKWIELKPLEYVDSLTKEFLADSLEDLPVVINDIVTIPYFGKFLSFRIEYAMPDGILIITKDTQFDISNTVTMEQVDYFKLFNDDLSDYQTEEKLDTIPGTPQETSELNYEWLYDCLEKAKEIIIQFHAEMPTDTRYSNCRTFFASKTFDINIQKTDENAYAFINLDEDYKSQKHYQIGIHENLFLDYSDYKKMSDTDRMYDYRRMITIVLVHELLHALHPVLPHDVPKGINQLENLLANKAGYSDALRNMKVFYHSGRMKFCSN